MVIFHSYVSLPEGRYLAIHGEKGSWESIRTGAVAAQKQRKARLIIIFRCNNEPPLIRKTFSGRLDDVWGGLFSIDPEIS